MHRDDDGDSWWKWLVGAVVVAVAAVAVVVTGGAAAGLVGAIAAGALKGAVAGAISGAVVGGLMGGVSSAISGGSFWSGLASGAADGFMMGAITGAILGGISGGMNYMSAAKNAGATHSASAGKAVGGEAAGKSESWSTIRRNYWKAQANDPSRIGIYKNELALQGKAPFGLDGKRMVLHHTHGRQGANLYRFVEMTQTNHIAFHKANGYHFYNGVWNKVRQIL